MGEVGGVGPAADGEEDLQVTVGLFEEEELLDAAVDVGAGVVPLGGLDGAVGWVGAWKSWGLRSLLGNACRCRTRGRLGSWHVCIRLW